jgi:hypothetical protein
MDEQHPDEALLPRIGHRPQQVPPARAAECAGFEREAALLDIGQQT